MKRKPVIFALSDSIGETAEHVAQAAAAQFGTETLFTVRRLARVSQPSHIKEAVRVADLAGAAVFYTLVDPALRLAMADALAKHPDVRAVDILGPAIDALSGMLATSPQMEPGRQRRVGRPHYARQISALEFAVAHDDGKQPEGLREADIVLIGVSRTSKTPLSVYLSYRGYKVANVPLIPGVELPAELFEDLPGKIVGLTADADDLAALRRERARQLGPGGMKYADLAAIEEELAYARDVMRRLGCPVVRTTHRAIEETADEILRLAA